MWALVVQSSRSWRSADRRARGAAAGVSRISTRSNTLRWIMLQVAQVAARHSPAARVWMARLRKRKPPQVALIALARKLLTAVWALLRHGVCFDEAIFSAQH